MAIQTNDVVNYIPHEIHAQQAHPIDGFPWIFGWKTGKRLRNDLGEEVVELTQEEAQLKMRHIRRSGNDREKAKLILLRPNGAWDAVVKEVHVKGDETFLDVDIKDKTTGATLHCNMVPVDETKTKPHSCHEK